MGAAPDEEAEGEVHLCLDAWWSISDPYERSQPIEMDARVQEAAVICIRARGLAIDPDASSPGEMIESILSENSVTEPDATVASCISDAVYDLFPDLDGLVVPLDR